VRVHRVMLLRAGRVPKITGGRVQRHACQAGLPQVTLERPGEN
jgi:hypothetical protein